MEASLPRRKHIYQLFFLAVIYLSSCAVWDYVVNNNPPDIQQPPPSTYRENSGTTGLPSMWVGKSISELVEGLGEPDLIIDTVPRGAGFTGRVATVCYVYLPKAGSVGACTDAYVVDLQSGTIIRYHCR
jgi:hypothetical protein